MACDMCLELQNEIELIKHKEFYREKDLWQRAFISTLDKGEIERNANDGTAVDWLIKKRDEALNEH